MKINTQNGIGTTMSLMYQFNLINDFIETNLSRHANLIISRISTAILIQDVDTRLGSYQLTPSPTSITFTYRYVYAEIKQDIFTKHV